MADENGYTRRHQKDIFSCKNSFSKVFQETLNGTKKSSRFSVSYLARRLAMLRHHNRRNHCVVGENNFIHESKTDMCINGSCPPISEENESNHVTVIRRNHSKMVTASPTKRISLPLDLSVNAATTREPINSSLTADFSNNRCSRRDIRLSLFEMGFGRISSYQKLEKLGEGTYATVYRGKSLLTDQLVALKEIRLEFEEGAPCTAIREASLLRQLRHANIVTLHDVIYEDKTLTLVFEYVDRDLKQYLETETHGYGMDLGNVRLLLFQLVRGLAYCHSRRILHRDLKPQNILINFRGELKLADFGLARSQTIPTHTYSNEVVTLWYRPPDVLLGSTEYSSSIDMWGVGCIFAEMVNGRPLFPGIKVEDQLVLIFKVIGTPLALPENCPPVPLFSAQPFSLIVPRLDNAGVDLLSQFLRFQPKRRISATASMRHSFFSSFSSKVYDLPHTSSILDVDGVFFMREKKNYNIPSKRLTIHL